MKSSNTLHTLVVLLLAALAWPPRPARAQLPEGVHRVLLLVVSSDSAASARRAERVFRAELESRQLEVVVQQVAQPHTQGAPPSCVSGRCLADRLRDTDAQLLVGLGLWLGHTEREVVLTLDDGRGPGTATRAVGEAGLDASFATALLDEALHAFAGRAGVLLRVEGGPPNSSVVIDHQLLGAIPVDAHRQPGPHDIVVAHVGYRSARRHIELGQDGATVVIQLEREAEGMGAGPEAPAQQAASGRSRPLLGPALLLAAGGAGVGWGAWSLSRAGCVERDAAGVCSATRRFSAGQKASHALALVAGGLAVVGAVLWFSLGGRAESPAVQLGLGPHELQLRATF